MVMEGLLNGEIPGQQWHGRNRADRRAKPASSPKSV
jgi:hypothetical protein